ncbi:bifunctional D-glycero-beta-D-manno-heptose-7-phosphate kinase/D-glycero-beta-D-manno-heptose 1-phosphate adenylyltransferase HldE [Alkalilimnicola ehrlichii]|uniref:bifunctional D-glycero-beta-D-manno-heptose-7-phosphate kinase/D-glycero-beta-D-manno-heptose 1-phosphate adenylyltransferase HldE n=1 Tax=Alkalilimnicola ehrlichii TaxID=351052 RepID=UPI00216282E5|nr:bifunctional D-glycero-beta-D-manno-heptose-7-phosphate kinase/D-glycero-beta-D-manno-heptose 1-phosphate adenylyltransferase HldE [Alkalilimnicola ehrlichii]
MTIPDFSNVRLLVAGDVMLDRYWYGNTGRISPEAPVPVVAIRSTDNRPGGAANVALGLAALGAQTHLLGKAGQDEAGEVLERLLESSGIRCTLERSAQRPTITKLRVISHQQQMIRLDFEAEVAAEAALSLDRFQTLLADVDAVILSDYAKGALQNIPELIAAARAAGKPVLIDPKQQDFSVYRGATLITPNRHEFERAVGLCHSQEELVEKGRQLLQSMEWEALLLTRGEEGMTLLQQNAEPLHIPAQAHEVFDVTGAGDTVIAVLAASIAARCGMREAAALANLAAGVVVGKLGTATVSLAELEQAASLPRPHSSTQGVVTEHALVQQLQTSRRRGERIVMTNGCFDLLHPGHVAYLEEARRLGDRLIVAVNDDASVARLKGPERPINTLDHRMAVLAGLASVDWVVPFSEDTPERLIDALAPDVLVKGGDYRIEEIAGHKGVLARGGEVKILPYLEAHSTTGIIHTIREK